MKVAVLESLQLSEEKMKQLEQPFKESGVSFVSYEKSTDPDVLVQEAKDADAVILANMPFKDDVIRRLENVKFIDVAFTGVDHIGLDACRQKHIAVSNASGYATEAVSELAVGSVLSLYRHLRENEDRLKKGLAKESMPGLELKGKTVGIIGLGTIGHRSAELFHAFGCRIIASKQHPSAVENWITLTTNEEVLANADIVLLHCPLNDSTRGMINAEKIGLMKRSAVLVNMARGPVVNTDDLLQALKDGRIAGAVSDVFDTEPPLKTSEPLLAANNTLLTPHIGFYTREAMEIRGRIVFDNLEAWMEGKQKNVILPDMK